LSGAALPHSGVPVVADDARSGDAYIQQKGTEWALGTNRAKRIIELRNGRLVMKSFRNEVSQRELASGAPSEEFFISTGKNGLPSEGWKFVGASEKKLKQGELQLDVTLRQGDLEATKSYVIYPESSITREWTTFRNVGRLPVEFSGPSFLSKAFHSGRPGAVDFYWMTSGATVWVPTFSWNLEKERLAKRRHRSFDSYDGFPEPPSNWLELSGAVDLKILLNDYQVWPANGWQYVPDSRHLPPIDLSLNVSASDRLVFLVHAHHKISVRCRTRLDPTITYGDGECHSASREFSTTQGKNGWKYQYVANGTYQDMVYDPWRDRWAMPNREPSNDKRWAKYVSSGGMSLFGWDGPYADLTHQCPGDDGDVARVWTAPKSGRVQVKGTVSLPYNTGMNASGLFDYGFKLGPTRYAPWYALLDQDSKDGILMSWDYFGHWTSSVDVGEHDDLTVKLMAKLSVSLPPGKTIRTPEAIVGAFRQDLDEAGNELLDWQYAYMWDYTRDKWFPGIRMLGTWYNSTQYLESENPWSSDLGTDSEGIRRNVFRVVDLMRSCGGDVWHEDWGWWKGPLGDWIDPDWRSVNQYLAKSEIGMLIYTFLYWVDAQSKVAKEHPDYVLPGTHGNGPLGLDLTKPEVMVYLQTLLDSFYQRWGDFEWRNDENPLDLYKGDDRTPFLELDQNYRQLMRDFLDRHPRCGVELCGAAECGGWDYMRYTSALQTSEGGIGLRMNYYAALLFPPDKTSDTYSGVWDPDQYSKGLWRGLLCINFDLEGETWKPDRLEGIRELIDIYHFLYRHGVVGRWVKVYRPQVIGDDPVMYFQRLSRDRMRGIVIPKRPAQGPIAIKPKGLLPDETYLVAFQEAQGTEKRSGRDLMLNGINIGKMPPGELIYLNLPMHPGSKLDTEPPVAPGAVTKGWAENLGFPGVELSWKPGADNNWISYYEVLRDGTVIDKVAKGCYYFDHSAGADLAAVYGVRTVDGAGNTSAIAAAAGPAARRSQVIDDAPGGGVIYSAGWKQENELRTAYSGTVSYANEKGASAEVPFEGRKVLVFAKLGANCGKASVSMDGGPSEVIDTHSADHIWGACVFRKDVPAGYHRLRMEVLGEMSPRGTGTFFFLDGVRAEQ